MIENILLIAAAICAVSAVTTSLRALGVSREDIPRGIREKLDTSCRVCTVQQPPLKSQRSSLRLHIIVTVIWASLSILFSIPFFLKKIEISGSGWLFAWGGLYLSLGIVVYLIWNKGVKKS